VDALPQRFARTRLRDTLPKRPRPRHGQHPRFPHDDDLSPSDHLQAIPNAGFHFACIEQGGTTSTLVASGSPARGAAHPAQHRPPRRCTSRPGRTRPVTAAAHRPHDGLTSPTERDASSCDHLIMPEPTSSSTAGPGLLDHPPHPKPTGGNGRSGRDRQRALHRSQRSSSPQ